jgi:hypothetical protein
LRFLVTPAWRQTGFLARKKVTAEKTLGYITCVENDQNNPLHPFPVFGENQNPTSNFLLPKIQTPLNFFPRVAVHKGFPREKGEQKHLTRGK